jgi:aminoglycoside N3'-acetyltransferase
MLEEILKKIVPQGIKEIIRKQNLEKRKKRQKELPLLSQNDFRKIISEILKIKAGDTVLLHSSTLGMNLDFNSYYIIPMLMEIVGKSGTILFPAYPKENSYTFLKKNKVFDIKKTPTYTGLLNEFARRHKNARRSLHPTKSVVAIGKNAERITSSHHLSPFPYDKNSPYYKITEYHGKIIGLGVDTTYLSCVHCVDDIMKDKFPVNPYHPELFRARCINYNKDKVIVETYAHNMQKMHFNLTEFINKQIDDDICKNIDYYGMKIFRCDANGLINEMMKLVQEGITIYSKRYYKHGHKK